MGCAKVNRNYLIARIAEKTGEYKKTVENILGTYEEIIEQTLLNGEDVHLHGFVTYQVKEHSDKVYVNPKTKESRVVPGSKKIKVKVSTRLNNMI